MVGLAAKARKPMVLAAPAAAILTLVRMGYLL
jgi:hypothetical protein